jgi:hypothetical protein
MVIRENDKEKGMWSKHNHSRQSLHLNSLLLFETRDFESHRLKFALSLTLKRRTHEKEPKTELQKRTFRPPAWLAVWRKEKKIDKTKKSNRRAEKGEKKLPEIDACLIQWSLALDTQQSCCSSRKFKKVFGMKAPPTNPSGFLVFVLSYNVICVYLIVRAYWFSIALEFFDYHFRLKHFCFSRLGSARIRSFFLFLFVISVHLWALFVRFAHFRFSWWMCRKTSYVRSFVIPVEILPNPCTKRPQTAMRRSWHFF